MKTKSITDSCICAEPFWSKHAVCIKDGSTCVLTTDVTCLKDINNAEAVLKLQAGFRPYYARDIYANEKSFLEFLFEAIDLHVSDICSELGIMRVDLKDWEKALFQEIKRLFEHAEDKESARPNTGNIDFVAAFNRKAFNACSDTF